MKKLLLSLGVAIALAVAGYAQSAVVIAENANLRGTANQHGIVVTILPNGTEVEIVKQVGPWFLIQSPQYVGWMHGNAIKMHNGDSGVYVPRPLVQRSPISAEPLSKEPTAPSTYNVKPELYENSTTPRNSTVTSVIPTADDDSTAASVIPTARCTDGTLSYSLHHSGTCSHHGGVGQWLDSSNSTTFPTPASTPSTGTVQVRGYCRKDGTYVHPYTRSAPRRH
jgi:hypothetical protein